jgi:hypothetical protein
VVGRSDELRQLTAAVVARRGAVITGPAGVGKTTLAVTGPAWFRWSVAFFFAWLVDAILWVVLIHDDVLSIVLATGVVTLVCLVGLGCRLRIKGDPDRPPNLGG